MEQNLILAGVGGQGILTIARAISMAALRRDLQVRQAEVHGMSQRGGAVQSHLRIADHELFSDLIPLGHADLVVAVEPLEALRYVQYLKDGGVIIAATNAFVNIENYPPIEQVLDRVAGFPRHVLLDADGLAKAAGSVRSANIVTLGAASLFLELEPAALEEAVAEMFAAKGPAVVAVNQRAFRLGRNAAAAYQDGLERGGTSRAVRAWIDKLPAEALAGEAAPAPPSFDDVDDLASRLTGAEAQAFEQCLVRAHNEGKRPLYEHEVYMLVELVGAISPPKYLLVRPDSVIAEEALAQFPGQRVALKLVSPDVTHKSDAGAVVFCNKDYETVRREMDRLVARFVGQVRVEGVLVVEFVEHGRLGFGSELFVGVRATREFGPVIAAGLGGVDTEYLASVMKPGVAVAEACAMDTSAEEFLALFRRTAAYDVLAGRARGHRRVVSDGELLRCFRAFIAIARHFCVDRGQEGPDVEELEVNPFAFRQERMVPLDGRGRIRTQVRRAVPRPLAKVRQLLEPASIAVLGVSSTSMNFGRIILNNLKQCGFPGDRLVVVKEGGGAIDGVPCAPSIEQLPWPVDLLVIAAPAAAMPEITAQCVRSGKVAAAIMIPGGVGETEGSAELMQQIRAAIAAGRERPDGGPVFLGPNCMGIQSRPGRYDTFFIPKTKLDPRWTAPARRVALISQSGAFVVSRLSNLGTLDPALTVSLGNQIDLTLADVLGVVAQRDDVDVIGVYAEGFNDLDGLDFVRAVRAATATGKLVVFYKAGRTAPGRSAAAGHTASLAGDYDVCVAAVSNAGALVVETFKQWEQMVELATCLHERAVGGARVACVSNAGFETVGMADASTGEHYRVEVPSISDATRAALEAALERHKLAGLVNPRNPLDLTPMATDAAYEECVRVLLEAPEVDALIASFVPLTPAMLTTAEELARPGSLAERMPRLLKATRKPVVVSIDSGGAYDALGQALRGAGVPVFRSCDQAMWALGRYLSHRAALGLARERAVVEERAAAPMVGAAR